MAALRDRIVRRRFERWVRREVRPQDFAEYGEGTVLHPPLQVTRRDAVRIGARSYVLAGAQILVPEAVSQPRLSIGSGTYLGRDLTIVCAGEVVIGDDVMGSDRLYIADVEIVPGAQGERSTAAPRPVRIEDGVFLGTGAMVLPGVTVGARSLVAAGAVVTADVPSNAVVAGNPARVVRHYDRAQATWVAGAPA